MSHSLLDMYYENVEKVLIYFKTFYKKNTISLYHYTTVMRVRFFTPVCVQPSPPPFSYFLPFPQNPVHGFDLFFIRYNIFRSWMSATIKNGSLPKMASISALLGLHTSVCASTYTLGGGPAAHNVNQSLPGCQLTSGYPLGEKRARWEMFSITSN